MFIYLIIPLSIIVALILKAFVKDANKTNKIIKILSIVFFIIFISRFLLNDAFIWVINGGTYGEVYHKQTDYNQSIARWLYFLLPFVFFISASYDSKYFKNLSLIMPIITILNMLLFNDYMYYFMTDTSRGLLMPETLRKIYFSLELFVSLLIPSIMILNAKYRFSLRGFKDYLYQFLILIGLIIVAMPIYLPQSLFGYTSIKMKSFNQTVIIWIIFTILLTYIIYRLFRFKSYQTRLILITILAIALFIHYHTMYLMGFSIKRLPLQLCNLGSYFFIIALYIKKRRFYDFVLIVNIVGAIVAMLAPDVEGGIASFWNMHFMYEHSLVFIIPFLMLLLRIMPRTDGKSFKYAWQGFVIYFLVVLVLGTIINGHLEPNKQVNFFFMFDISEAEKIIGFFKWFKNNQIVIAGRYVLYPAFQIFIFLGYTILLMLFTLILKPLYNVIDDQFVLRTARIEIYEKLTKRTFKGPKNYQEDHNATN